MPGKTNDKQLGNKKTKTSAAQPARRVSGEKLAVGKSEPVKKKAAVRRKTTKPVAATKPAEVSIVKMTKNGAAPKKKAAIGRKAKPADGPKDVEAKKIRTSADISNKSKLMQNKKQEEEDKSVSGEGDSSAGGEMFVRWTGKNFIQSDKDRFFYKASLAASILAAIWSAASGNWLPAVTFLTAAVVMLFELRDVPRDIEYEINIDGILIDAKLYRFDAFDSFDVAKKAGYDIVRLKFRNSFFPVREIHIAEDQDPVYIETLLEYFLPNEIQEELLFNFDKRRDVREADDERGR